MFYQTKLHVGEEISSALYIVISCGLLFSVTFGISNNPDKVVTPNRLPIDGVKEHQHERIKRGSRVLVFNAKPDIPENVGNNVSLFDLTSTNVSGPFTVIGNSAGILDMFEVNDGRHLHLNSTLGLKDRKMFDYEAFPTFEVYVEAGSAMNAVDLAIRLSLSDVNDEPPQFVMEAWPFLAQVASDATPWTIVYDMAARDEDGNPDLEMKLVAAEPKEYFSRFKLQQNSRRASTVTGSIVVSGSSGLPPSQEITLFVTVEDRNAEGRPQVTVGNIYVLVGVRAPQFYSPHYIGYINESIGDNIGSRLMTGDNTPLFVKVVNFDPSSPVDIRVLELDGAPSARFEMLPSGQIWNRQVLDFERTKNVDLILEATSRGSARGKVSELRVIILDENDNGPQFAKDNFMTKVREDTSIDSIVLSVAASDIDSGANGDLTFSLPNNDDFYIDTAKESNFSTGYIKIKRGLDYDSRNVPELTFPIHVVDKGIPARTAIAHVIVTLVNINDNKPEITIDGSSDGGIDLLETTAVGSVVTVVLARDADYDGVTFAFKDGQLSQEIFTIAPTTGVIKTGDPVDKSRDSYVLTIVATDDGTCCEARTQLTSSTTLTVNIIDINSNKPVFTNCNGYDLTASVMEQSDIGTSVIVVQARDLDRGENGRVIYEIDEPNSHFDINSTTGVVTVREKFDRQPQGYEQVTVKGTNPTKVPLMMGWCSFRVQVEDLNDNPPKFPTNQYDAEVLRSATAGEVIVEIVATDSDIGDNARITYGIRPLYDVSDGPTFTINERTGVVSLIKRITQDVNYVFEHIIVATDSGIHPTSLNGTTTLNVKIVLEKTGSPSWINPPNTNEFHVDETAEIGHVITNLTCHSSYATDPRVSFIVYNAEDSITAASKEFDLKQTTDTNTVSLVVADTSLDYEKRREYVIYVVCQDYNNLNKDAQLILTIKLKDTNDERPRLVGMVSSNQGAYVGSAPENAPSGSFVTFVQAVDDDTTQAFKNITFSINSTNFIVQRVSDNQARILTNKELDREADDILNVKLIARDGAPSAHGSNPNTASRMIRVDVTDVNDNPPVFNQTLFSHTVSESANVNDLVLSVVAHDVDLVDTKLDYVFVSGNTDGVFSVISGSGEIRIARKLDYDTMDDKVYKLKLQATDQGGVHNATTRVEITVLDQNDNPPKFTHSIYEVNDKAIEHDTSVTQENPLFLIQVSAVDNDQQSDIRYSFLNPSNLILSLFTIDSSSGVIHLTGALDRHRLEPFYTLAVKAEDQRVDPLIGYAEVKVYPMDVNDRPVFERENIEVFVNEHSPTNTYVATIQAMDTDQGANGTVRYKLVRGSLSPDGFGYFAIGESSGQLTTKAAQTELDRKSFPRLFVMVQAYDLGTPQMTSTATVTVVLNDINDRSPTFLQGAYNISVSESTRGVLAGYPIKVKDEDADLQNRLFDFTLQGQMSGHFFVQPSANEPGTVFLAVKNTNPLDFEENRSFHVTIHVTDGVPTHTSSATVSVYVTDYNDNTPVFEKSEVNVTMKEGTSDLKNVTQLSATDADDAINAQIVYSISRDSDPRHEFYVGLYDGKVTTRKVLDREKDPVMMIVVVATDKGKVPLSSSATVMVTIQDINDCAPQFKEAYRPKVEENVINSKSKVVEIFAIDQDTQQFGPPFGFKLSPQCDSLACQRFQLEVDEAGDGGNGTAIITTSTTFDREAQKEYHLPIVMWDMRGIVGSSASSQTATNTLTIVIGDVNDNGHFPGHQDIHVYNYRGTRGPKEIGRVFVRDLDDWDLPDKSFTAELSPILKEYFSVDRDSGMITMFENVPPNKLQPFLTYDFNVKVYDKQFDKTVESSVSVTVDELTDEAVWKSGSMRVKGITAEDFISKMNRQDSRYNIFRRRLSSILGYADSSHVEIVSIQESHSALDIRFSGHGSPYLNPAQLESAVMLHQSEFETILGATIEMLPINLCMEEIYDVGCSMVLNVSDEASLVNTNSSSYVGVKVTTMVVHDCLDCTFPIPDRCNGGYCYNGGKCYQDDWGKITCQCHPGFDGPRCQQRRHHFDGTSVAFYRGLSACVDGRTMFDFITLEEDGLVMYAGSVEGHTDKFIFELKSGYPRLTINLGSGELVLTLDGLDRSGKLRKGKMNDGKWHHVDVDKRGQHIQLTIDKCATAEVTSSDGIIYDWSPCRASGVVPGRDFLLNTPGFLHVGGPYPRDLALGLPPKGFSGCLKNLIHNTKLYDLSYKKIPAWNSGKANCPREDQTCQNEKTCGQRADCMSEWLPLDRIVECACHPGWTGEQCEKEAPIKDFGSGSFLEWELGERLLQASVRVHRVSMMFRTRQNTGTLFSMTNDKLNLIVIKLSEGKLVVSYNMGVDDKTIVLDKSHAATGQWHTLLLERYSNEFDFSLDNGEGRTYSFRVGLRDAVVAYETWTFVSSGAQINHVIQDRVGNEAHAEEDLVNTCVRDIRYNGVSLPMGSPHNTSEGAGWGVRLVNSRHVRDGCTRQDCAGPSQCEGDTICHPLWEEHECRPPPGEVVCGSRVCFNGGECVTVNGVTSCRCVYPWVGVSCNISGAMGIVEGEDDALDTGIIAGIVIGILFLLILLVLVILLVALWLRREDRDHLVVELEDQACENIMYYDEEGAGEKDCDGYNLSHLQPTTNTLSRRIPQNNIKPDIVSSTNGAVPISKIGQYINDRIHGPSSSEDQLQHFGDEGSGSIAGSLSSLPSSTNSDVSQDYDYLGGWGPKFSRLADMYGVDADTDASI